MTERGFVHMDTPGYDPVSVTGQVAGGCNVVTFTTGRGSAFGFKPAPSIKIATNSELYAKQEPDMDINAGKVLDGVTLDELGQEIFEQILAVASGEKIEERSGGRRTGGVQSLDSGGDVLAPCSTCRDFAPLSIESLGAADRTRSPFSASGCAARCGRASCRHCRRSPQCIRTLVESVGAGIVLISDECGGVFLGICRAQVAPVRFRVAVDPSVAGCAAWGGLAKLAIAETGSVMLAERWPTGRSGSYR